MRIEEIIDGILEKVDNVITKFNSSCINFEVLDKTVKKIV